MTKVLITGGASGLGKELVKCLSTIAGIEVYFTYCNSLEAAKEIEVENKNTKKVHCDFRNSDSIQELCNLIETETIDVVVNNALPFFSQKQFYKLSSEDVIEGFGQNVVPVLSLMISAVGVYRKMKKGKIINILSSSTFGTPPLGYALYTAEKKYIESISKSIAFENAKFNIQVNCVSPSFMETELNDYLDHRVIDGMRKQAPMKRFLDSKEVSDLISFLVRNESIYLNGQNINLNAGR